jgi:prepilin-type N-terminal cleavage/methylation domain-containing protein
MNTSRAPQGFTLMEILVAILLLAILAVSVIGLNSQLFMQSANMHNLQIGTQLQQACLEHLLDQRKSSSGFNTTFSCSTLNSYGFTLSVTTSALNTSPCPNPNTFSCKKLTVEVAGNGIQPTFATLMFVDY